MADHDELQSQIGYRFEDAALLRLALTHPSVSHGQGTPSQTNQRLEFLGDAVLQLVLSRELFLALPGATEGHLTKARASLVNRRSLADRSRLLGLGQHLIVSRGEEYQGGRERLSALADTYEALLGAIFLDGGFEAARTFIMEHFDAALAGLSATPLIDNPKGELQELLQAASAEPPRYHVISVTGPDHDRVFECIVRHGGLELARGCGKSKKLAESAAAATALRVLRGAPPVATDTPAPPPENPPS